MATLYCSACGEELDLRLPEGAQTFRCPFCSNTVRTDYTPAYADEPDEPDDSYDNDP